MKYSWEPGQDPRLTAEVVYAGGTISSVIGSDGARMGGQAIDLVAELDQRIPNFEGRFNLGQREVAYTGLSENMDYEYWNAIEEKVVDALERNPRGVIVTHGTESMEQTARRLNQGKIKELLEQTGVKVILTGANDDISMPETDAWNNLEFAFDCIDADVPPGVYIAFGGKLIPADKVVKKPFDYEKDKGMNYIANDDPEYLAALQKQKKHDDDIIAQMETAFANKPHSDGVIEYSVNIVRPNHDEFLEYIASHNVSAVLLRLYHGGTANTEAPAMDVAKMVDMLRKEKGIVFFGATENGEPIDLHAYETSVKLRQAGVVPLYDMPHDVAAAKLRLVNPDITADKLIREMLTSKVGEIDETRIIDDDINYLSELYRAA